MALIAHGGTRRISALLAYLTRARVKAIATQTIVTQGQEPTPLHHYPSRRDRVMESAAMAREMYRL